MARVGKQDGCGRAMWEYEPEEDQFGTPMALMLLPMWTNECIGSEEGLFFESSATVPYHFLNQSELSANPSRAMRDLPYRNFNIVDGIQHMQLLGVRYYMAVSPTAQAAAKTLTTGPHPLLTPGRRDRHPPAPVHGQRHDDGAVAALGDLPRSPTASPSPGCRTSRR